MFAGQRGVVGLGDGAYVGRALGEIDGSAEEGFAEGRGKGNAVGIADGENDGPSEGLVVGARVSRQRLGKMLLEHQIDSQSEYTHRFESSLSTRLYGPVPFP